MGASARPRRVARVSNATRRGAATAAADAARRPRRARRHSPARAGAAPLLSRRTPHASPRRSDSCRSTSAGQLALERTLTGALVVLSDKHTPGRRPSGRSPPPRRNLSHPPPRRSIDSRRALPPRPVCAPLAGCWPPHSRRPSSPRPTCPSPPTRSRRRALPPSPLCTPRAAGWPPLRRLPSSYCRGGGRPPLR